MAGTTGDHGHDGDFARRSLPIVVGGCHRSGTTLVRQILDGHSRISCGPELKFFVDFHDGYTVEDPLRHARFTTTAREHVPKDEAFELLGRAFLEMHAKRAQDQGKARWADKNPENVLYLESRERLLGERWVLVHVSRDIRDVLASMEEAGFPFDGPDRVERRVDHHRRCEESAAAFAEAHPARYFRLAYETLVGDPPSETTRLMNWLGERFEPQQLDAAHWPTDGLGDPKARHREEVGLSSVGRWRRDLRATQVDAALEALRRIRPDA